MRLRFDKLHRTPGRMKMQGRPGEAVARPLDFRAYRILGLEGQQRVAPGERSEPGDQDIG